MANSHGWYHDDTMVQDVFKSVEKLCAVEGIDCEKFMYRDNTAILETLEGPRCVAGVLLVGLVVVERMSIDIRPSFQGGLLVDC